jgi:Domain of unknown function (DUF4760)
MIADFASVVAALTLVLGVVTLYLDHRRRRRQATLDAYIQAGGYRRALTEKQRQARKGGDKHSDEAPLGLEEAIEVSDRSSAQHDAIRDYLNFWENIAIGARFHVFDKKVLRTMSRHVLCGVYSRYAPYIYLVRWGENQPTAYEALEGLALEFGANRAPIDQYRRVFQEHLLQNGR